MNVWRQGPDVIDVDADDNNDNQNVIVIDDDDDDIDEQALRDIDVIVIDSDVDAGDDDQVVIEDDDTDHRGQATFPPNMDDQGNGLAVASWIGSPSQDEVDDKYTKAATNVDMEGQYLDASAKKNSSTVSASSDEQNDGTCESFSHGDHVISEMVNGKSGRRKKWKKEKRKKKKKKVEEEAEKVNDVASLSSNQVPTTSWWSSLHAYEVKLETSSLMPLVSLPQVGDAPNADSLFSNQQPPIIKLETTSSAPKQEPTIPSRPSHFESIVERLQLIAGHYPAAQRSRKRPFAQLRTGDDVDGETIGFELQPETKPQLDAASAVQHESGTSRTKKRQHAQANQVFTESGKSERTPLTTTTKKLLHPNAKNRASAPSSSKLHPVSGGQTNQWRCAKCTTSYQKKRDLVHHENDRHLKGFRCAECGHMFHGMILFQNHLLRCGAVDDETASCGLCHMVFPNVTHLPSHIRAHAEPQSENENEIQMRQMKKMGIVQKPTNVKPQNHATVNQRMPWTCGLCKRQYRLRFSLIRHIQLIHDPIRSGDESYEIHRHCRECDDEMTTAFDADVTIRVWLTKTTSADEDQSTHYQCNACQRTFTHAAQASRHLTHHGVFVCSTCRQRLKNQVKLSRHVQIFHHVRCIEEKQVLTFSCQHKYKEYLMKISANSGGCNDLDVAPPTVEDVELATDVANFLELDADEQEHLKNKRPRLTIERQTTSTVGTVHPASTSQKITKTADGANDTSVQMSPDTHSKNPSGQMQTFQESKKSAENLKSATKNVSRREQHLSILDSGGAWSTDRFIVSLDSSDLLPGNRKQKEATLSKRKHQTTTAGDDPCEEQTTSATIIDNKWQNNL